MTDQEMLAAYIAKKADHLAKAVAAHEEMGKCLSGECDHKGVGKCMEKMADLHEKMGKHLEKLGKEKDDAEETDEEKAAKAAEIKKAADAKAAADKAAADAAAASGNAEVVELKKTLEALTAKVTELEKTPTVVRATPIRRGITFSKSDDNPDPEATKEFEKVKKDDPNMVQKAVQAIRSNEPVLVD